MNDMFETKKERETLLSEEITEITGCRRKAHQINWLAKNGWTYYTNRAGYPIVGRAYARMMLSGLKPGRVAQVRPWQFDESRVR